MFFFSPGGVGRTGRLVEAVEVASSSWVASRYRTLPLDGRIAVMKITG